MKKFYSVNSSARKFSFDICVNFKTILKWPVLKVSHYQTDNKGCKQKQPLKVFYKKSSLKNFLKCTGKPLDYSLFFNKIASACSYIKKAPWRRCLFREFWEIFKSTFAEHRSLYKTWWSEVVEWKYSAKNLQWLLLNCITVAKSSLFIVQNWIFNSEFRG